MEEKFSFPAKGGGGKTYLSTFLQKEKKGKAKGSGGTPPSQRRKGEKRREGGFLIGLNLWRTNVGFSVWGEVKEGASLTLVAPRREKKGGGEEESNSRLLLSLLKRALRRGGAGRMQIDVLRFLKA